jgi:hypothetical protein
VLKAGLGSIDCAAFAEFAVDCCANETCTASDSATIPTAKIDTAVTNFPGNRFIANIPYSCTFIYLDAPERISIRKILSAARLPTQAISSGIGSIFVA